MKKTLLLIGILIAVIFACNQDKKRSTILTTAKLPSEFFTINITRDTTLLTKKGALIHIPKGALEANAKSVKLEVKEAYSIQDIISAGLTTQSNGQPLSSGGMIYINPVGEETVNIKQALSVATPANFIQKGMQQYKGVEDGNGNINWQDTVPLAPNPQLTAAEKGEKLFIQNCATCHRIDKVLTGPALAYTNRQWGEEGASIDRFIRNPAEVISWSCYYQWLYEKWNKTPMPTFEHLTDDDLNSLFTFIENESRRLQMPVYSRWDSYQKYNDSCHIYLEAQKGIIGERDSLISDNGELVELEQVFPPMARTWMEYALKDSINRSPEKVIPKNFPATYYQFKVETFGWINIDMMLKDVPGIKNSTLSVKVLGDKTTSFNIFLVIPSRNVFQEGGPLKGKDDEYGFDEQNGQIPLPQGEKAIVFLLGEGKDEILFDKAEFIIQENQELQLTLKKISKDDFDKAIANMGLDSVKISVQDSKNAIDIRKNDKALAGIDTLKPKNFDCNCILRERAYFDSLSTERMKQLR